MIRLRVINGTLPDKRLCDGCRNGTVMKDSAGGETVYCGASSYPILITKKIVECSDFRNRTEKTLHQLESEAWILSVKGKTILGFKPPNRNRLPDDI